MVAFRASRVQSQSSLDGDKHRCPAWCGVGESLTDRESVVATVSGGRAVQCGVYSPARRDVGRVCVSHCVVDEWDINRHQPTRSVGERECVCVVGTLASVESGAVV